MPNFTETLFDSTPSPNLYCVWVPVQDEGRSRLTAIWIDRAMTAFTSDGTGTAATCTAEHQEEDVDLLTGEDPPSILSRRS